MKNQKLIDMMLKNFGYNPKELEKRGIKQIRELIKKQTDKQKVTHE